MIALLPNIIISLFAFAVVLSMVFIVRGYRKSISALEERLQTLEGKQEIVELAGWQQSNESGEEAASVIEERLQVLERNYERLEQAMKDQAAKNAEESILKNTKLKENIKALFTSSIDSVLKKTEKNTAEYKNQLELLSDRIDALQQNIRPESAPEGTQVSVAQAKQQNVPAEPQAAPVDAANAKAKRLARLIVSEIALYNRKLLEEAVRNDTFNQLLEHDIKEARKLYARRVPEEILNSTTHLDEAFTELIAKTKRELNM
jgi:hypothetical protein